MKWTADLIRAKVASLPVIEDEDEWREAYVFPVEEFDLIVDRTPPITNSASWDFALAFPTLVDVSKIISTWQCDGVRIDAVAWYLDNREELFDREGWFEQDYPVLISREDGTFTVRDGNHRIISDKLRGRPLVLAYIVE